MLSWFGAHRRPLYLAPMAGVTNSVFRQLCKEQGADVLVSEFVSAEGILHCNERTRQMVRFNSIERPIGIQLFGANPAHMADAARAVMDWVAPDFIDLNFGCPVNKVVCREGGSALLKNCPLLERVTSAVVQAVSPFPVTAKIRLGWDARSINATTTSKILAAAGIEALAIHGRTKEQGYSGAADWDRIAEVAASVDLPVIGNGDLNSPSDIVSRFDRTGVRGAMIGRAAMGNPWLFAQTKALINFAVPIPDPSLAEKWAFIVRHCRLAAEEEGGQRKGLTSLRSHLMAYSKGMPGGRMLRAALQQVVAVGQVEDLACRHLAWAEERAPEEMFIISDLVAGVLEPQTGSSRVWLCETHRDRAEPLVLPR